MTGGGPNTPSSHAHDLACPGWQTLISFEIASQPGNERQAVDQVAGAVEALGFSSRRLERLRTAVAEATMNAMEHGNQYDLERPVRVRVDYCDEALAVLITDFGGSHPKPDAEMPDLDAKLAGLQSPRGWGLFLIQNMVDEINVSSDDLHHTVQLVMHRPQGISP